MSVSLPLLLIVRFDGAHYVLMTTNETARHYPHSMGTAEYNVGCCIGYKGHDTSASAAFAFRTIPELDGVVDILSWWTFTDVRTS